LNFLLCRFNSDLLRVHQNVIPRCLLEKSENLACRNRIVAEIPSPGASGTANVAHRRRATLSKI
jgi:hypothetical protein